jgi:ABC-type uncharacterized transport system involved in gliding motility auxiliary subunit
MSERSSVARGTARRWLERSALSAGVLLAAALLAMVNYLGYKYHGRFDWTSAKLYTLSEKSRNVLAGLDREVEILVLMSPASPLFPAVEELVDRYAAASPRISVELVDPERNPARAGQLLDRHREASPTSVVFVSGDDLRVVEEADLAEYDYGAMQYGQEPTVESFLGEQLFTGAILDLVEGRKPKILFVGGHGEARLDDYSPAGASGAKDLLERDNFALEEWSSLGQAQVPEGADLVVLAAPRARLLASELDALGRYVEGGGRLLVLAEPSLTAGGLESTGFEEWLAGYGVRLGEDVVVDPRNALPLFGAESFTVSDYAEHPVTASLEEAGFPVLLSLARSVRAGEAVPGVSVEELLFTSADAWGETDLVSLESVAEGEGDTPGPVSLGVVVSVGEKEEPDAATSAAGEPAGSVDPVVGESLAAADAPETLEEGESGGAPGGRMVVMGDADFATNAQLPAAGNPTLLLDTVNWLVEREDLLGIPPKPAEEVRLDLTRDELRFLWLLLVVGMPALALAAGALVFFERRR